LIRELEPALMRLALVDARLFTDKHHAARMLVQEVTHRSLAYATVCRARVFWLSSMRCVRPSPLWPMRTPEGPEMFADALQELQAMWNEEAAKQAQARTQAVKALEKAEQTQLAGRENCTAKSSPILTRPRCPMWCWDFCAAHGHRLWRKRALLVAPVLRRLTSTKR